MTINTPSQLPLAFLLAMATQASPAASSNVNEAARLLRPGSLEPLVTSAISAEAGAIIGEGTRALPRSPRFAQYFPNFPNFANFPNFPNFANFHNCFMYNFRNC